MAEVSIRLGGATYTGRSFEEVEAVKEWVFDTLPIKPGEQLRWSEDGRFLVASVYNSFGVLIEHGVAAIITDSLVGVTA